MPFSATRDMWLVLKARDEANRALRSFSANVRSAGQAVALAQVQANRAAAAAQGQELALNKAIQQTAISRAKLTGASANQVRAMELAKLAIQDDINANKAQQNALRELELQQRRASDEVDLHAKRLQTFTRHLTTTSQVATSFAFVLTGMGVAGVVAMKNMVDVAVEYQRQVALTQTQVDGFNASMEELSQIGLQVARNVAVPFEQIQPALFDIFSSTNANLKEATLLLEGFSKAAVAGATSIENAGRGTIAVMNGLNIPFTKVNDVLDVQFQLVRKGVGTYEEFAKVFGRVIPSANRAGSNFETVAAMLAFLTRNGLSAAMAAASAGRAFDAMSNVNTVKKLKAIGVAALDAKGNFRPLIDVLTDLRAKLQKLPAGEQRSVLQDLLKGSGGTIQARRFLDQVLLKPGELEEFTGFLNDMNSATGQFGAAYGKMSDTVASKSQLLRNRWEAVREQIGEALIPVFMQVVDVIGNLLEWFNKLDPEQKKLIAFGIAGAAALSLVLGVVLFLVGGFAALIAVMATAGTAMLVVGGVIAGLIIGITGLTAAIVKVWRDSESFRNVIIQVKDSIIRLWKEAIVPFAKDVADSFNKNIKPSLDKVWNLIETKILPAFTEWIKFVTDKAIPKIKETARLIGDILGKAFDVIGLMIEKMLIPAIEKLSEWWEKNKENIKPLIPILLQIAKWLAVVAGVVLGVLVVALVGPLIAAISIIIAALGIFIVIIGHVVGWIKSLSKWLSENVPKALRAVGKFFQSIWQGIADFFVGIWNGIVAFFSTVWQIIQTVINAGVAVLRAIWEPFWNTFGGLFKAIWDLIVAIVKLGIAAINFVIQWGLKFLSDVWNAVWGTIKDAAIAVWNAISGFLTGIWNAITTVFSTVWNAIVSVFKHIWDLIGGHVTGGATEVRDFLSGIWTTIRNHVTNAWNAVFKVISDALGDVWDEVTGVFNDIVEFFAGAIEWLRDAGRNIIKGLINGMTDMLKGVTDTINNITKTITDHLPHSPAKKGPLSGQGSPFYSGQSITKMLADGMNSQMNMVLKASSGLASSAGVDPGQLTGINGGSGVTQNFTINTQEINPRRQAAELGFLLAVR